MEEFSGHGADETRGYLMLSGEEHALLYWGWLQWTAVMFDWRPLLNVWACCYSIHGLWPAFCVEKTRALEKGQLERKILIVFDTLWSSLTTGTRWNTATPATQCCTVRRFSDSDFGHLWYWQHMDQGKVRLLKTARPVVHDDELPETEI